MAGCTFRRGAKETRGRKRKWSTANARQANQTRIRLYKEAKGEREIAWAEVLKKSRVPKVHPSTAARSLARNGIDIKARTPRQKPARTTARQAERVRVCTQWQSKPGTFFSNEVDLIMDNKYWPIPMSDAAKRHARMGKVRFHLRTRGEGLTAGFTKPSKSRHRMNPGGSALVCAGIIGGKVRVWHYLSRTWNASEAEKLYREVLVKALKKFRPGRKSYKIIEDNDPSGYKSNAANDAKHDLNITPLDYPPYSPDLNPLDFFLWAELERRMSAKTPRGSETVSRYKNRLRRTSMSIPENIIRKAVESLHRRAAAFVQAGGGDIARD